MKNNLLTLIIGLILFQNLWGQSTSWIFPPKLYDINSKISTPLPIPSDDSGGGVNQPDNYRDGYDGQKATITSNCIMDANNELLFFIVDEFVYNKDGYSLGELRYMDTEIIYVKGTSEISIIPDPENCQKYYIISVGKANYEGVSAKLPYLAELDFSRPNQSYSLINGELKETTGWVTPIASFTPGFIQSAQGSGEKQGGCTIAASKLRPDNSRFVFISNGYAIFRYKIDANGFNYDDYIIPYSNPTFSQQTLRSEMELIELGNGNYRIASTYNYERANQSIFESYVAVFTVDLFPNGNIINGTERNLHFDSNLESGNWVNAYVHGLEFSPSGNILYITHNVNSLHNHPIEFFDFNNTSSGVQPFVVSDEMLFKFSQIELGVGNKIYFASDNYLASISNPDNPKTSNWNAQDMLINYQVNYEGSAFPGNSLTSYVLPDQIDGMNYKDYLFANYECCKLNSYYHANSYTTVNSGTWTKGNGKNPFNSNSGEVYIKDELRISAGTTITIKDMVFKFGPNAKVIIEQGDATIKGGRLILDKTTFTVYEPCGTDKMWEGVEIWGITSEGQGNYNTSPQGWLSLRNDSKIEHARIGAMVGKRGTELNNGGVIVSLNSTFKNNGTSVWIKQQKYGAKIINSRSYFKRTKFIWDGDLKDPNVDKEVHLKLTSSMAVNIVGCEFTNYSSNIFFASPNIGQGIYAFNSQFYVDESCDYIDVNLGCQSPVPSTFNNLLIGINVQNSGLYRSFMCQNSNFLNCDFGINVNGTVLEKIALNHFTVRSRTFAGFSFQTAGIVLNGSTDYEIEENIFTVDPANASGSKAYGIVVKNSGEASNEIYKNYFHDLLIGGQSEGVNAPYYTVTDPSPQGLQWKCNEFNSSYDHDLTVYGRIDYHQGYTGSNPVEDREISANNKFSLTGELMSSEHDIQLAGSALQILYAHLGDASHKPDSYTQNWVSVIEQEFNGSPVYADQNTCPSRNTSYTSSSVALIELDKRVATLDATISNLQSTIDQAEKPDLLTGLVKDVTGLKNTLLYRRNEYTRATYEMLRYALLDSSQSATLDNYVSILKNQSEVQYLKMLMETYYAQGENLAGDGIRSQIENSGLENDYLTLVDINRDINEAPYAAEVLINQELYTADLNQILNSSPDSLTLSKAQSLLNFISGFTLIRPFLEFANENTGMDLSDNSSQSSQNDFITIYPNPSEGIVVVATSNSEEALNTIIVSDLSGKIVYNVDGIDQSQYTLDLSKLKEGIYLVKTIDAHNSVKIQKLYLNR
jgi:hypothetical protein